MAWAGFGAKTPHPPHPPHSLSDFPYEKTDCHSLHANGLCEAGQSEERIQNIVVWWEANCFDERKKAPLAWTESATFVAETRVPDDVYERACCHFSEQEVIYSTYAICAIGVHNRLALAFRRIPGR